MFETWLDEDGYHIWQRHNCLNEISECMLPYPRWHLNGNMIEPSINCLKCGLHLVVKLGV